MLRSILLLSMIAVAATGCGKKPAAGTEGDPPRPTTPPSDDPTLTPDFFPQTGVERHLIRKQFADDGSIQEKAFCVSFGPELEKMWPTGAAGSALTLKHRRTTEYLEYIRPDAKEWTRFLKLGAKPGESWEYKYGAGTARFTYKEFTRQNDKPCAVLEYTFLLAGKSRIRTTEWYLRGVGYVRDESSQSDDRGTWAKQSEVLYSEWSADAARRYDDLAGRGQPTPPVRGGGAVPGAIDAAELLKRFHEDGAASQERYTGKGVVVTGDLDGTLFPGIHGGPVLYFQGPKSHPGRVYFVFDGDQKLGTLKLKNRQPVVVEGTFAFSERSKAGSIVVVCKSGSVTHIDVKAVPRK